MRARTLIAPLIGSTLLLAACGRGSGSGSGGIDHPTGAGQLVLRVDTAGGFVGPNYFLSRTPEFSLFGDGLLVAPGPQIEIYPGPALPNVLATQVSEEGIQAILQAAQDAGLFGPDHQYTTMVVSDAPTTTFTVYANGEKHVTSVYALGESGGSPQMSEEERKAREELSAFQSKLSDLQSWLPQGSLGQQKPFDFSELRVYVQPSGGPGQGPQEPPADWPLSQPLASLGQTVSYLPDYRCGVVSGSDLAALLPAVRSANELTPWRSGGSEFRLLFRPLLPDEHGC